VRRGPGRKRNLTQPDAAPHRSASAAAATRSVIGRRHHWIESDAYDRATLARLRAESPSLQALQDSGSRLLPHFDGFVLDLFALLFKLNIVVYPDTEVVPSAAFYQLLLEQLRAAPAVEVVRQQTVLDETRAGLATVLLGDRLLQLLKSERILSRAQMLDYWNLEQQESEIGVEDAQATTAIDLRATAAPATQRQLDELAQRLRREVDAAERRLQQRASQLQSTITETADRTRTRLAAQAQRVLQDLEESSTEADSWGVHLGGGEHSSAGAQIELGKKLADNAKLRKLGQMVGRMRAQALALRRKLFERADAEMYEIGTGAEVSRLLPHELLALRHPILRRDFARRFLDAELLQYALRAVHGKGRGPMVVCIDGSSSMAGDKEIWSKAVSLTLLDIARRQRRLFRSICFASADMPLQVLDLNRRQRYFAEMSKVLELAEYFPGGGTDFQKPLNAALDCLQESRYRHGDIVFITDGECRVDREWLSEFKRSKERLGFSLFSVLIDVGSSSLTAVRDFSDKVTTITQLTSEAGKDIFLQL
jgi:uncharacterized protein with von Willebrand factor type A (vWA) domain